MSRRKATPLSFKKAPLISLSIAGALLLIVLCITYYKVIAPQPLSLCLPFETQDWEQGYCYATCNGEASCAALDEKYTLVQDTYSSDDKIWYYDFSSIPIEAPPGGFAPSSASTYTINTVENGMLGKLVEASSTSRYQGYNTRTWHLISFILPTFAAKHIAEYAGFSDVVGGTAAFVFPTDESSHTWSMNINYAYFYTPRNTLVDRGETIHTLVHEIGHVMTLTDAFELNTYTIDLAGNLIQRAGTCYTTQFIEGCLKAGSFAAIYTARFWPEAKGNGDASGTYDPKSFVSSYAATSISEDMAETWTAFVLLDKPTGTTLADQKVLFFYQYPAFVAARAQILKNINRLH